MLMNAISKGSNSSSSARFEPNQHSSIKANLCFAVNDTDSEQSINEKDELLRFIDRNIIGCNAIIETPFGSRRVLYADYTASGRSLQYFEDYIQTEVLPLYANTHTTCSATGRHSTNLRAEARGAILQCVGGEHKKDVVLFAGSGCTGAVMKLVNLVTRSHEWRQSVAVGRPPLVLLGPYEHHSNILPWRESGATVLTVREAADGGVDMTHLEELLKKGSRHQLKIGSFSAASNITGILSDTVAISIMLHRYDALAFFDYASGGPYLEMNMNPYTQDPDWALAYKDAIFISPHKFIGGVGTPGVLVAKSSLFQRFGQHSPPCNPGGGTVLFVTENDHQYLDDVEEREEGGTPDIVGAIRTGLVFLLKDAVGHECIMHHEHEHWHALRDALSTNSKIKILGNQSCPRVAVLSFMIRHGKQYLHHNFVAVLLNDLFGIQVRAGCACAGPYASRLLEIDAELASIYGAAVYHGHALVKPGFVRFNANYFVSSAAVSFLAKAVLFVAEHGWKLLPLYSFHPETSEWTHRAGCHRCQTSFRTLGQLSFESLALSASELSQSTKCSKACHEDVFHDVEWAACMTEALAIVEKVSKVSSDGKVCVGGVETTAKQLADEEAAAMKGIHHSHHLWFVFPSCVMALLESQSAAPPTLAGYNPFVPASKDELEYLKELGTVRKGKDDKVSVRKGASRSTSFQQQQARGSKSFLRAFQCLGAKLCG